MKTISIRQFAAIKRVAQNVNLATARKNKVSAQLTKLYQEYTDLENEIKAHEAGIIKLTGGYMTENLVTKVVEPTGKVDKDGRPIKVTKYEPKAGFVVFNEETKYYEIHDNDVTMDKVDVTEVDDDLAPEYVTVEKDIHPVNSGDDNNN